MPKLGIPLVFVAYALSLGQAPMPTPVSFAWDPPLITNDIAQYKLEWPGGFSLFPVDTTNATIDNFPLGVALPVTVSSVGTNGLSSTNNSTIYVLNLRAIFEEADYPEGPWTTGPEAHILVERKNPKGFFRVRLEIQ